MAIRGRGELFRDPQNGKIAGVCAGLANYLGWETWLVRILLVSGVLFGMPWFLFMYIAAWFILDKKKEGLTERVHTEDGTANVTANQAEPEEEHIKVKARVWQAGEPPKKAFHDISRKFLRLETQLQTIERHVTSSEFTVTREINRL